MIRRVLPLLLVVGLTLGGLVGADDPPPAEKEKGDAPLRLKRKKRDGAPPASKEKDKDKPDGPAKKEKKSKDEGRLVPEDGPPDRDEDDKEVLDRISRNMRAVEEKLGNRELGEPTRQQQRDILEDIDRLLKKSEQQQNQDQNQDRDQQQQQQPQAGGGEQQKQKQQMNKQRQGGQKQGGKQKQRRQLRHERDGKPNQKQPGREAKGQEKPKDQPEPKPGEKPGAGSGGPRNDRDLTSDLYRNVWGHLPESLRAEMNAYSNPSPFLPRYDRIISEYYKTIARKGRQKGD